MDSMHREQDFSKSDAAPATAFRLRDFGEADSVDSRPPAHLSSSFSPGVQTDVTIVLGRVRLNATEASQLHAGSLVVLEQETSDPVDIFSGGRLVGRGQVVVIDDKFCVRVVELNAAEQAA
jgi:flagellar motor switch protein FliN/FliY